MENGEIIMLRDGSAPAIFYVYKKIMLRNKRRNCLFTVNIDVANSDRFAAGVFSSFLLIVTYI